MAVVAAQGTHERVVTSAQMLLRRRGAVYLPEVARDGANADAVPGVEMLETDLLNRGWLVSPALRDALVRLAAVDLVGVGAELLADCDALLGARRPHRPLFRNFPASTPRDTGAFYVDRVLSFLLQHPDQPCVLCDGDGKVQAVNPCGHLVCPVCFDGADFSGCPICHRRINVDDPFLKPSEPRPQRARGKLPRRLRMLHLGADLAADARAELAGLLPRPTALSPDDAGDLVQLLDMQDHDDLSWVPGTLPGREIKAYVLAFLLRDPLSTDAVARAGALVDTATDVLRLLVVRSGGDASLITKPRLAAVSRPLRRTLLSWLDRIAPAQLVEDMRRHRRAWIAAGEKLHPGEFAARYPNAALAFAALRGSELAGRPAGVGLLTHAASTPRVEVSGGRVSVISWGRAVESALARGDAPAAAAVLVKRPGEFVRRLDHLLRVAGTGEQLEHVFTALRTALPGVSAAVLLSALGEVRTRARSAHERVFFPAARIPLAYLEPDGRGLLPASVVTRAVALLEGELLRRAGTLPAVDWAIVDSGLDDVVAPFAVRAASRSLVPLARGSTVAVPPGQYLRLFCHWMQSPQGVRVDLDLSVALYDADWRHVGTCDYTDLRGSGMVHSGDLTSAPGPLGASEFIDVDFREVTATKARYAAMLVFSYNDVPFTDMAEAFAGVMVRDTPPHRGEVFDARDVEQRFDLTGPGRMTMPFVFDLETRTMRWLDVTTVVAGATHAVHNHERKIAMLASALIGSFEAGSRVSLGELARWHAAARATGVLVRTGDTIAMFVRRSGETAGDFAARLATTDADGDATPADAAVAGLQFLVRGDLPTPPDAQVYALYPADLNAARVHLLNAPDLATLLDPDRRVVSG